MPLYKDINYITGIVLW